MKRRAVIAATAAAAAMMSGCASQKTAESTHRIERHDTLRASLAEELSIRLDDVVIIPRDTLKPMVIAGRVELRREQSADVSIAQTEESESETREETQPPPTRPMWKLQLGVLLTLLIAAYIAGARRRY